MIRNVPYTLYVLENIGLPLLIATLRSTTARAEESEKISAMLDRTVSLTQEIEKSLILKGNSKNELPLKLQLAQLASKLVAARMEGSTELLAPGEYKDLLAAMNIILARAEQISFSREESVPEQDHPFPSLSPIATLEALSPIIDPIAEFSFGQPEKKLIQNVSDILLNHSKNLLKRLAGTLSNEEQEKQAAQAILGTMGKLYAETHSAETKSIMKMDERIRNENASQITIDIVWRTFERKSSLLEALVEGLIPAENTETQLTSHEAETNPDKPADPPPPAPTPADNPLSFFVKTSKK